MYLNYLKQQDNMKNFELLYSLKANDIIPVSKYRSKATGLTVCIAQVEGPLVNGYFCLATEAHDDDGLPHTLEHLVFMGSEEYPYKGVLDLLANRCLASGTNAWTDTDHTCYTMTTAGSEGFLNLMPIYLDHVLYPTLTESAYITEVHHINGEGDDAGVVYCEMQARENSGESLTHLHLLRAMYPGHCGYKSETGGIMKNLRESTSNTKVQNYHREFYRPENLCLVITGQVDPSSVFNRLQAFEDKIVSKGKLPPHTRPWQTPIAPLEQSVDEVVPYPSDDEQFGLASIAWRGPNAKDQYAVTALMVVLEYLTDTAVAPLQQEFVEREDPYCSKVKYSVIENLVTCVIIGFRNVPKDKLPQVKDRLFELLAKIGSKQVELDMKRMSSVIHRRVLEAMDSIEDQPHDTLAFHCIGDFLFGNNERDFSTRINQIDSFKKLKDEPREFWLDLINNYMVDKKYVSVIGLPSKELMEKMGKEEQERVKKQAEELGEGGLKSKHDRLEKATEENEVEAPDEMLVSVDVPDVGSIHFHTIHPSSNRDKAAANSNAAFPLADIPVTFQLDDITTNFVNISVLMDTGCIPVELKAYLPLFLEVLTETPILRNGVLVSHEDVITELAADTVSNGTSLGDGGSTFSAGEMAQLSMLHLKLEVEKYEKGVTWARELLYQTQFTADRLKIVASKMANDIATLKRKGPMVVRTLGRSLLYNKESNHHVCSMMRQHKFLTKIQEVLEGTPEQVIDAMNNIRRLLTHPDNIIVHLTAHVASLAKRGLPQLPWQQNFFPAEMKGTGIIPSPAPSRQFLLDPSEGQNRHMIVGVGAVESGFLVQCVPCVTSYSHEDYAPIMVLIQYLTQLEGPMWRQIRGLGLSYSYSMFLVPESGLMYFTLFKSSKLLQAFKEGKSIVEKYLDDPEEFDEVELETCKSSLIFEIIEEEKTPSAASGECMMSYFRGVDPFFNRTLIQKISQVNLEDLERVGATYFRALFDPNKVYTAICSHPTKVDEICKGFEEFGQNLTVLPSLEDPFLSD